MRLVLELQQASWHPAAWFSRRRAPLWQPGCKLFAYCWSLSWFGWEFTVRVQRWSHEWALWYPVLGTERTELPRDGVSE